MSKSFVVYFPASTYCLKKDNGSPYFSSEAAAKAAITRVKGGVGKSARNMAKYLAAQGSSWWSLRVCEAARFHATVEKSETKVNLMSGKAFTQPVNTPLCCDPSSETYWSM